ncbi:MAG TPA: helix-turn-helix domain-containing protein [Candidatus Limnocylindrales bacterium]
MPSRFLRRRLDARSLVALAHPLRVQLRTELRLRGPATATELARRLGESSGSTSYHLRMLARHGFVETEPGRGKGRERWWRAVPEQLLIDTTLAADPTARAPLRILTDELHRRTASDLATWQAESDRWAAEWRDASTDSIYVAHLDAAETAALRDELDAVISGYAGRPDRPGARIVEVQVSVFPTGEPE